LEGARARDRAGLPAYLPVLGPGKARDAPLDLAAVLGIVAVPLGVRVGLQGDLAARPDRPLAALEDARRHPSAGIQDLALVTRLALGHGHADLGHQRPLSRQRIAPDRTGEAAVEALRTDLRPEPCGRNESDHDRPEARRRAHGRLPGGFAPQYAADAGNTGWHRIASVGPSSVSATARQTA